MDSILNKVNSPEDLKKLSIAELNTLAGEIREFLIENVTETGGHLASNLGAVELTLALHYVFDSPKDKFVFDVGHQSYVHKIITGRRDDFKHLRQLNGMSGFPKPSESPHDHFKTGHSSTSISVATGFSRAMRLKGDKHSAIAVIGDGALTGGMAFEALNDIGDSNDKIIVVFNDNQMSIDKNVGALNSNFSKIRSSPAYHNLKRRTESICNKIPVIGKPIAGLLRRFKKVIKTIFVKNLWFEEMGFTYIGLIDGHDIEKTINALTQAKNSPSSVVVHLLTKKGKGYAPAESNPEKYHGVSPKNSSSGSNSRIAGDYLTELAGDNKNIVAITAAMTSGTGLDSFAEKYPKRFFDVGIAEQHAVTMAGAMASQGLIPVFAVYSTFLQRGYDQIVHDIAMQGVHAVFLIDRAGIVGADGETHHGILDISFLRHIPGTVILEPSTQCELKAMIKAAIYDFNSPVFVRYPREQLPKGYMTEDVLHPEIICELSDVNIIACGRMIASAKDASNAEKTGLINARVIKPLNSEFYASVLSRGKTIVVEDNVCAGGFGSSLLEFASENNLKADISVLGIKNKFVQHGKVDELESIEGLDEKAIVSAIQTARNLKGV